MAAEAPPGEEKGARRETTLVSPLLVLLTGGIFLILVWLHVDGVNGPDYWRWPWLVRPDTLQAAGWMLLAATPFVFAHWAQQWNRPILALTLVLLALSLTQWTTLFVFPGKRSGLERLEAIVTSPIATSYFDGAGLMRFLDAERDGWLADYHDILPFTKGHAKTKPPGPVAFYYALRALAGDAATPLYAGIFITILSLVSVLTLYLWTRALFGPEPAFHAAALMAAMPSFVVFFPELDLAYPILSITALFTWHMALEEANRLLAALCGAVMFAASMMSYALLVVGAAMLVMLIARLSRGDRRALVTAAVALGSFLVLHIVFGLLTGFDAFATFLTALDQQDLMLAELERPYPRTVPWDLVDFAFGAGWIPVTAALLWAVRRMRVDNAHERTLLVGLLLPVIVALSGLLQSETARVWIFLLPLLAMASALEMSRWGLRWRVAAHLLLVCCSSAVAVNTVTIIP